jgi:hypothetical protein
VADVKVSIESLNDSVEFISKSGHRDTSHQRTVKVGEAEKNKRGSFSYSVNIEKDPSTMDKEETIRVTAEYDYKDSILKCNRHPSASPKVDLR